MTKPRYNACLGGKYLRICSAMTRAIFVSHRRSNVLNATNNKQAIGNA